MAISKELKEYHRHSRRHVLVLEATMPQTEKYRILSLAFKLTRAGNELVFLLRKNYLQLKRSKKYRKLLKLYRIAILENDESKRVCLGKQLEEMRKEYNLNWDFCRKSMIIISKKFGIPAVFGLTKAEDIWSGVKKCLYKGAEDLHFRDPKEPSSLRAKTINRGIILNINDKQLIFKIRDICFAGIVQDKFQEDELAEIIHYFNNQDEIDNAAVETYKKEAICIDTFRPCFITLVPKIIRGKYRIFIHITIEAKPKQKLDKMGKPKHYIGKGIVGCDVGVQSAVYTSDSEVNFLNLAERSGIDTTKIDKEIALLSRAMDRSRRKTNPQNYDQNNKLKEGELSWNYSRRYMKIREKHRDLCRKRSINIKIAINTQANYLLSLGNIFITEPPNAAELMKKTNNKPRYGKSISKRCPSYFQSTIKRKFRNWGGEYIEVSNEYRASQFDHTANKNFKRSLSDRMIILSDGTEVQRDWYSSFLLYCYNFNTKNINIETCNSKFSKFYEQEKKAIEYLKDNNIKIFNSGF